MNSPARATPTPSTPATARATLEQVATNLSLAVRGKDKEVRLAVTCVAAGGHLLLEDVPGVGKTTLVEAIGRSFALSLSRVQFTADLMPADILGAQIFHAATASFAFRPGPIFRQLVLADELNRAPPRTQSALLEAMAQGQVSLDGITHPLPRPFTVVATQNPVDFSGTYPLPDSQLDRFLMRLSLGHPAPEVEARLLVLARDSATAGAVVDPVSTPEALNALRTQVGAQRLDDAVADYVVRLAQATRSHGDIERGASTRAVLALGMAARAHALWEERDFVTPGDVRAVLGACWAHRLLLRSATPGTYNRDEALHLLEEIARKVPAPR